MIKSLKSKITLYIVIFTTVPLLMVAVYLYTQMKHDNEREYVRNMEQNLDNGVTFMNMELNAYKEKSSYLMRNTYLYYGINKPYNEDVEAMFTFYETIKQFVSGLDADSGMTDEPFVLYITNESLYEGKYIRHISRIEQSPLYEQLLKRPLNEIYWSPSLVELIDGEYLLFYQNIVLLGERIGVIEMKLPFRRLQKYMDNMGPPEGRLLLYSNEENEILYLRNDTDIEITDAAQLTPDKYLILTRRLDNGHFITVAVSRSVLERSNQADAQTLATIYIPVVLLLCIISIITSRSITRRLNQFIRKISSHDDLLSQQQWIEVTGQDEIAVIEQKFVSVINKLNQAYRDVIENNREKAQIEMDLHQSLINPHLLYNSLSVIRWNALRNEDRRTVDLIDAMTHYYRSALRRGDQAVPLHEELRLIREYVQICEFSHSCEFQLQINVEEDMLSHAISRHLLQPIVENAILHGLDGKDHAIISIRGYMNGTSMVLEIADNGYGMDQDQLERLTKSRHEFPRENQFDHGYGIHNVMKRLKGLHGEQSSLVVSSQKGEGTIVTITLVEKHPAHF